MALQFTDAGQVAEAAAPIVGPAFTLAGLYRFSTPDGGTIIGLGGGTSNYAALAMLGTGQGFFEVSGGGTADAFATGTFSTGPWHSLVGVETSDASRVFYADGTAGPVNTSTLSPGPPSRDRVTVGMLKANGNYISSANGDVAEVAVWDIALTAADAAMLAAFVSPLLVRPDHLVLYSQLRGNAATEIESDIIGGRNLVWDSRAAWKPVVTAHPAVLMPPPGPSITPDEGVVSLPRAIGDIVSVSDALDRIVTAPRAIGDVVSVTDAATRGGLVLPRAVGDPVTVTDAAARGPLATPRAIGDPVVVSDAVSRAGVVEPRQVGDPVSVSDAVTRGPLAGARSIGDPVPVSDSVTRGMTAARVAGDVVSTSDAAVWMLVAPRQVGDPVPVSDSATRGSVTMTRAVGDVVLVTDAVSTPQDIPPEPVRVQYELHMRAAPVLATVASVAPVLDTHMKATT